MSQSVYARCRDGALYKNPILVFTEGFVCFDEDEPPELVLWMPKGSAKVPKIEGALSILERIFGSDGFLPHSIARGELSERVRPRSEPWVYTAAHSYFFAIDRRIPRPTFHDGTQRYKGRLVGVPVFDWPAQGNDATEIEMPK